MPNPREAMTWVVLGLLAACGGDPPSPPAEDGVEVRIERPIVLADGVFVPQADPRFVEVTTLPDGRLRFVFSGGPARPFGEGAIIVGNEGAGYMGRVTRLEARGDEVIVALRPVGLDEVVADGAFVVSIDVGEGDREASVSGGDAGVAGIGRPLGGRVALVPGEVFDGAGSCAGSRGITGGVRFAHELETRSLRTEVIFDTEGLSVRRAGVKANGRIATKLTFEADGEIDVQCMLDVLALLRARGIPLGARTWTRRADVGPLPLSFTATLTPRIDASAIVVVEPSRLIATFEGHAELNVGAIYDAERGFELIHDLERRATPSLSVTGPGAAGAEVRLWSGVDLGLSANLLQLPSLGAKLDAHAWIRTDDVECGYNWEAAASGSVFARGPVGVDLGFFSHTFATLTWEHGFEALVNGGGRNLPWCGGTSCGEASTCAECNGREFEGCGWCPATGCVPVGPDGASTCEEPVWTRAASCVDCSEATTEAQCGRTSECSWCVELGACVNAAWCATIPSECGELREGRECAAFDPNDDDTLSCVSEETETLVRHGECGLTRSANGMMLRTSQFCVCRNGAFDCADLIACGFASADLGGGIALAGGGTEPLLPTRGQLRPVRLSASGPLLASNNPETVYTPGALASTAGAPDASRAMMVGGRACHTMEPDGRCRSGYPIEPPIASRVGSGGLDGCPDGLVRDLDVYVAHIMRSGLRRPQSVSVGVVPRPGSDIEVSVEGRLASGPWDTIRTPSFVSASVARDFYFGAGSRRSVSASCGGAGGGADCAMTVVATAADVNGYIDGRLHLSSSECFEVWVTANSGEPRPGAQVARPTTWALGGLAWRGWAPSSGGGEGRSSGIYRGGVLTGGDRVVFERPLESRGYAVALAETAQAASIRLGDSAHVNFGDYGGLYDLSYDVVNEGASCLLVRSELVSYAALQSDQRPTFGAYNPLGYIPQIYWNGTVEHSGGSDGTRRADFVLRAEKDVHRSEAIIPSMRHTAHAEERLELGESRTLRLRITAPGMISAPLAVVFSTRSCPGAGVAPPPPPPAPRPEEPRERVPPLPEAGASCRHTTQGGVYGHLACSRGYQCCDGRWRGREACGGCSCVEETGAAGCGAR